MDREEKLLVLFMGMAFFGLLFHLSTTTERMARDGYLPFNLKGDATTYWFRPHENTRTELEHY